MNNPWVRWIVLILGALVALAALGAGALVYLVSRIDVRAEVERAVEDATGRDLTIAGDVGVSLWPVLGLHAADASLANVEGGRAPALAAMDDIHVGVEIRPLFNREVVVRQLVLQHPRIALEVDAQGHNNWSLAARTSPAPAPAPTPAPQRPAAPEDRFSLQEIRTENGEISYYDARRGAGWVIGEANLNTALTSLNLPMRIEGNVSYAEQRLALAIEIAAPRAAFSGRGTAVKLNIESELLNANFDGATTAASGEMQGLVSASGPSLRRLAALGLLRFRAD